MDSLRFEPRYNFLHFILYWGINLLWGIFLGGALYYNKGLIPVIVVALAGLAYFRIAPIVHVRALVFDENFIIVRYMFTDRYVKYSEIKKVGSCTLETVKGVVRLGRIENKEQFEEMIEIARERGLFSKSPVAKKQDFKQD